MILLAAPSKAIFQATQSTLNTSHARSFLLSLLIASATDLAASPISRLQRFELPMRMVRLCPHCRHTTSCDCTKHRLQYVPLLDLMRCMCSPFLLPLPTRQAVPGGSTTEGKPVEAGTPDLLSGGYFTTWCGFAGPPSGRGYRASLGPATIGPAVWRCELPLPIYK